VISGRISEKSDRKDSINPHFDVSINADELDIILMALCIYPAYLKPYLQNGGAAPHQTSATPATTARHGLHRLAQPVRMSHKTMVMCLRMHSWLW